MEVFGIIWLISLTVGVPIAAMRYRYRLQKLKLDREQLDMQGGGMTLGELKGVLREVVEEANQPVLERLEVLERLALPPAPEMSYHDTTLYGEDMELESTKTLGRRGLS